MGDLVGDGTYLTLGEAVRRLKSEPHPVPIGEQTLRRQATQYGLRMIRIGIRRDRRFLASEIDALKERMWAEANPEPAGAEPTAAESEPTGSESTGPESTTE